MFIPISTMLKQCYYWQCDVNTLWAILILLSFAGQRSWMDWHCFPWYSWHYKNVMHAPWLRRQCWIIYSFKNRCCLQHSARCSTIPWCLCFIGLYNTQHIRMTFGSFWLQCLKSSEIEIFVLNQETDVKHLTIIVTNYSSW